MIEAPKCDAGCGEDVMVRLDDAGYCDDCFGRLAADTLQQLTGWRPCCWPIYPRNKQGAPALCLERWGTEHDHSSFFCD